MDDSLTDLGGPVDLLHVSDDDGGAPAYYIDPQQPQGGPGHVRAVLVALRPEEEGRLHHQNNARDREQEVHCK